MSACRRLVADLTVRLDARTADAGVITYLFDREPVLSLGYSPGGVVYELRLAGVRSVLQRVDEIFGGDGEGVPTTLRGTLRLAARVLDDTAGAEAGELELGVTEAIAIGDDSGPGGITLEPSRVFRIGVDEGYGEARLDVDWGALRLVTESGSGSSSGAVTSSVRTISLGGLSLVLDATEDGGGVTLRNVGIGGVPLTVDIDGSDALTLALEPFGASLDAQSGTLTFDTALGVGLMIDNMTNLLEEETSDFRATFEAAVPAGTRLLAQENGTTRVEAGGPVTTSFVASDGERSVQSELSATVGNCVGEAEEALGDAEIDEPLNLAVLPCD